MVQHALAVGHFSGPEDPCRHPRHRGPPETLEGELTLFPPLPMIPERDDVRSVFHGPRISAGCDGAGQGRALVPNAQNVAFVGG